MNEHTNFLPSTLLRRAAVAIAASGMALSAQATLVNTVPIDIAASTITFSPFDGVTTAAAIPLPVDVGTAEGLESVILTTSSPTAERILGAVNTDLGTNGTWPFRNAFAGLNTPTDTLTFSFTRGMNFAGGYVNYDPQAFDGSTVLAAVDNLGNVLEEVVLNWDLQDDAQTPGLGFFLGFHRSSADIWGLTLSNGEGVIDDLSFGTTRAVPEPGVAALLALALAGLGWQRRRR